jgi:hypothetical protein
MMVVKFIRPCLQSAADVAMTVVGDVVRVRCLLVDVANDVVVVVERVVDDSVVAEVD